MNELQLYSAILDVASCIYRRLFVSTENVDEIFVREPLSKYLEIHEKTNYQSSEHHQNTMIKADKLLKLFGNPRQGIETQFSDSKIQLI